MKNWDKYTQLDIGAGTSDDDNFLHLDITPNVHTEIIHDVRKTLPFPRDRFDKILMQGVFEHLAFKECGPVLHNCHKVLKPNGILEFTTPDLMTVCKIIIEDKLPFEDSILNRTPLEYALSCLYGGQDTPYMFHKWGWTNTTITRLLEICKFKIEKIDNNAYEDNTHLHIIARAQK